DTAEIKRNLVPPDARLREKKEIKFCCFNWFGEGAYESDPRQNLKSYATASKHNVT